MSERKEGDVAGVRGDEAFDHELGTGDCTTEIRVSAGFERVRRRERETERRRTHRRQPRSRSSAPLPSALPYFHSCT